MIKILQNFFDSHFLALSMMVSVIMLSPFYLYASGLPQLSHILILFISLIIFVLNRFQVIKFLILHKSGLMFLSLVIIINSAYALLHQDITFIVNSSYWFFNLIFLIAVIVLIRSEEIFPWISSLIVIQLAMIFFSYLLGLGGYQYWPRYNYFFNGPNQLAYFALCLFLVYIVVTRFKYSFAFLAVYSMMIFAVFSSGGRSAYLGLIPLVFITAWVMRIRLAYVFTIFLIPLSIFFSFSKFENQITSNEVASQTVAVETFNRITEVTLSSFDADQMDSLVLQQLSARGYLRAIEYPKYLLFGAGQGYEERFIDRYGYVYEIHSSLFAVIFYYGIGGAVLFLYFIWTIFKCKINIILLSPLIFYGLFTYGLRSIYFWLSLAFLSAAPNLLQLTKDSLENNRD